jgi:hypothetical protein
VDHHRYVLPVPMSYNPGLPGRPSGVLLRILPNDNCPFLVDQGIYLAFERAFFPNDSIMETIISSWSSLVNRTGRLRGRILVTG